uniref:Uncharacterized protein n=1 Tax=Hucho hucho TaxID=62062 RepID=A0A4W5JIL8_9TELE
MKQSVTQVWHTQTFGSNNLHRVGVILQRAMLILLLFCLPCWGLLINAHNILLAINQEQEVARIAQLYVMLYLPAVPAMFLHQLQTAYLQNQGIILPQMYTAAAANLINLAVNYILLFSLEMGVMYCPSFLSCSCPLLPLLLLSSPAPVLFFLSCSCPLLPLLLLSSSSSPAPVLFFLSCS